MHRAANGIAASLFGLALSGTCHAQEAAALTPHAPAPAPAPAPTLPHDGSAPACCVLADGTIVTFELLDPISSARAQRGEHFRMRLIEGLAVEGVTVVPAGTEGVGEIVHAEQSRGGGKPGELLLAARHLQLRDRVIKLRGFKLGGSGRDTSHVAVGLAVAIGPFAQFVHGKEIEIPAHTTGTAKLGETVRLLPSTDAVLAPSTALPSATPATDPPQNTPASTDPSTLEE